MLHHREGDSMVKLKLVGARSYSNKDKIRCLQGDVIDVDESKAEYLLKTGLFEKVEDKKAGKRT